MGLNFTTTTLINSNLDPDSGKDVVLFEKTTAPVDGEMKDVIRIKRDFTFFKDNIKVVRKKVAEDAVMCKATVDFETLLEDLKPSEGTNYCKLDIYVEYEGAEPFYGANPLYTRKGIPFWVEFSVKSNSTAEKIVSDIAKSIKKNQLFLLDKDMIDVKVEGSSLVLEGNTEYMRFKTLNVCVYDDIAVDEDKVAVLGDEGVELNERGSNGFGTYSQIVKDLRLPTAANYQWTHVRQVETPIIGAKYDQYIVEYCAPANNEGFHAVGQRMLSHTTHIFWVNQNVSDEFGSMFTELGVTISDTDAWLASRGTESTKEDLLSE